MMHHNVCVTEEEKIPLELQLLFIHCIVVSVSHNLTTEMKQCTKIKPAIGLS